MQKWLAGAVSPYVFHMCWTQNKDDKVKYLKQLGGWFISNKCDARPSEYTTSGMGCCTAEPQLQCFYKDKVRARCSVLCVSCQIPLHLPFETLFVGGVMGEMT